MRRDDLLGLLDVLESEGVPSWLDGGWGVDALLGEQTRDHGDVDIVVPRADLERLTALLRSRSFEVVRDWLPTTIAFRDEQGREVDLHPVDPTPDGGGDQVLPDGRRWHYAAPVTGLVAGRTVRCAPVEDQLLMHQGYEPRAVDHADVRRLVQRFGLRPPAPFDDPDDQG